MISLDETKEVDVEGTIFVLKTITGEDTFAMLAMNEEKSISWSRASHLLKAGIKEVRNIELVKDEGGIDVKEITDEFLKKLPGKLLTQLIFEINDFNTPGEEDVKN